MRYSVIPSQHFHFAYYIVIFCSYKSRISHNLFLHFYHLSYDSMFMSILVPVFLNCFLFLKILENKENRGNSFNSLLFCS